MINRSRDIAKMRQTPRRWRIGLSAIAFATLGAVTASCAVLAAQDNSPVGPSLQIDVDADRHAISPDIYGMAYPDAALSREIHLPLNRWGGDATTRYNWEVDGTNAGDDWFFMAGDGKAKPTPSGGPDALLTQAKADGGRVLLTIPIIDYINKATETDCTFPVSIFGPQQKTNPYVHPVVNGKQTDAGNGRTPDGKPIQPTREQILRIHVPNSPDHQKAWIRHLVQKFGTTAKGGVGVYELDNEPGGWGNTHRDIHPGPLGHDELVKKSIAYAAAIKSVDPTALVLGPGDFMNNYQNEGAPGDGSKEHGGLGQGNYYLQQMAAYEKTHHVRLLDYFDGHYYPTAQDGEHEGEGDEVRLEATRSLWDPTYVEKNWIGKYRGAIALIPNFHKWVNQYYPGSKIGISEYGWADNKTLTGALCLADVLGIFGRERLGLACLFGPPRANEAAANAFRIYRNYDGKDGQYGDTWVRSVSENQSQLAVYGAQRTADGALTLVMINKTSGPLKSALSLAHFAPSGSAAQVYRFDTGDLQHVVRQTDQPVTARGFTATYPTRSITLLVLPGKKG